MEPGHRTEKMETNVTKGGRRMVSDSVETLNVDITQRRWKPTSPRVVVAWSVTA